jgi:phosphonate transport system substrate-binding protein
MSGVAPIWFTSIQAPNADPVCVAIAECVGAQMGTEVLFTADLHWLERRRLLLDGNAQIGWVCGLPYVLTVAKSPGLWLPLVAPVMTGARYRELPVYFSDVVVRADSPLRDFSDLRGCRWAYNEPESHSGTGVVRDRLATLGEDGGYFREIMEAGSHQAALELILEARVDAAAIDSTVLETELRSRPGLEGRIRVIESLGPSPAPLWVAHRCLPEEVRSAVQFAFLNMTGNPDGQRILSAGAMLRFVPVDDADYDPIRRMAQRGESVTWRRQSN